MTTRLDEAQALEAARFWIDQIGNQVAAVTEATAQQAAAGWSSFTEWTTASAIGAQAAEAAAASVFGQETIAGLMAEYMAQVNAVLTDTRRIQVPRISTPVIRNGADLTTVHARTAKAYRLNYAKTGSTEEAIAAAMAREMELIETDLMLAARQAQIDSMKDLEVTHYRRVLHPELSRTGSCGLCLAASLNVYTTEHLMPIHVHCKCVTMPIIGGKDPAAVINEEDRKAAYAEADATTRQELSQVRVQVHQHGELGPILTVKGQKFTGPKDLQKRGGGSGGGGRRTRTGGSEPPEGRLFPHDHRVVHSGELRGTDPGPVATGDELEREGLIAPESDPKRFFDGPENAAVTWLEDRGVTGIRSVNVADARTPDMVLSPTQTGEIKTLKTSGTDTAVYNAIRGGRGQSRRIVIDGRDQGIDLPTASAGIKRALGVYGLDFDEVIVILGDGKSVGWWRGK